MICNTFTVIFFRIINIDDVNTKKCPFFLNFPSGTVENGKCGETDGTDVAIAVCEGFQAI